MRKPESPCKSCKRSGCGAYHDICKEHNKYLFELGEYNGLIKEAKKEESDYMSFFVGVKGRR